MPKYHPAVKALLRFFEYEHLPIGSLREVSYSCVLLANTMAKKLPDGTASQLDEKITGLRKLLEAKDCFVRAMLPGEEE